MSEKNVYEVSLTRGVLAITWDYEDVQWQTAMIFPGKMLSNEGVEAVLFDLLKNHDAEVGVNWDTIACFIRERADYLIDDPCGRGEKYL